MQVTQDMIENQNKRLHDGLAEVSDGIAKLKADRGASKHYAAIICAIASARPAMSTDDRAALAHAINMRQLECDLVDKDW